ncbi:DNA-processing protein DprA [Ramlibacter rhizophilus]|uniref:DNA-protecting protein DprA n=1 Tax=Ramlibacter rhizophilus TaxID=1781167 RepID=A0A4Z0BIY9_9BURK|nr:DNA-processing protein DprA [Ramlibacter rhizophilus]TFY97868.1 DNA-protecting protein DprA [Ramlibacter rhizophilus]
MAADALEGLDGWLRLALTPQVGALTARRLLAAFGLPDHIFGASAAALAQVATSAQVNALRGEPEGLPSLREATRAWLAQPGRRLLTLADADYPQALLEIADPPLMLWVSGAMVEGQASLPWPRQAIAIVGSRNPTAQGASNARQFARSFAQAGWCVVSGLALGVDGAAHEGALEGSPGADHPATVAVVGTGLDRVYPRQHLALAHRIHEHGLMVSEYPLGTPPLPENFPRRNRLIAGLARGTLVVEAAVQSGSLITARMAAEQGREVFAIPGSIHSVQSRGCHALIKQGAKLVETAQDVMDELLPASAPTARPIPAEAFAASSADPLLGAAGHDPVSLDALQARTGLSTAELQVRLLELELAGELARLPGGLYQRMGSA